MAESKRLTLKKPLSLVQQAKLYKTLGFVLGKEIRKPFMNNKDNSVLNKRILCKEVNLFSS